MLSRESYFKSSKLSKNKEVFSLRVSTEIVFANILV